MGSRTSIEFEISGLFGGGGGGGSVPLIKGNDICRFEFSGGSRSGVSTKMF